MENHDADPAQTLVDHLTELRIRLIKSAYAIVAGFGVCWFFSEKLFDIIRRPIQPYLENSHGGLIYTAPMDKFVAHLKVSFLAAVIVSAPFWLYQVWKFIAPGLYAKEKKYATGFIFFGTLLFSIGVCFVYFFVFPMAFHFLMTFGGGTDQAMITIDAYLSFFTTTTLVFGLAFEMPLILLILGMMGVVNYQFLSSKRRYAIVILAAVSAVITPPDALSMIMMLIPLCLLYELSIWLVRWFAKKEEITTA